MSYKDDGIKFTSGVELDKVVELDKAANRVNDLVTQFSKHAALELTQALNRRWNWKKTTRTKCVPGQVNHWRQTTV